MYRYIFSLLLIVCIFVPVLSDSTSSLDISGVSGTLIATDTFDTKVQAENSFNAESGHRVMIMLGPSYTKTNQSSNSKYHNTMDSSDYVEYDEVALVSDRYSMEDQKAVGIGYTANLEDNQTPSYQAVSDEFVQMGSGGGRYKSASIIDDANITTSMRSEGTTGFVSEKHSALSGAGFSPDSNDMINFEKSEYGKRIWGSKNGTGWTDVAFDRKWTDHSKPIMSFGNSTNATNSTNDEITTGGTSNITLS